MSLKDRFRITIGAKLVGLIASLLLISIVIIVALSTHLFIQDNTALIQQMNADTAHSLAVQVRDTFENLTEKMQLLGAILISDPKKVLNKTNGLQQQHFSQDKDILLAFLHVHDRNGQTLMRTKFVSPDFETNGEQEANAVLSTLASDKDFSFSQLFVGEAQVSSVKLSDGSAAVALGIPLIQNGEDEKSFSHAVTAIIRPNRFIKAFTDNAIGTSFMVDRRGRIIAHPNSALVAAGENLSHLEIVKELLKGKFNNGQTRYIDPDSNQSQLGAFRVVGFGGLGVVTQVPESKAFEAARRVEYRAMLVALVVLCLSFLVGYLYSETITWPIKQLVRVAQFISEGNFKINLRPKSRDEVASLAIAFNEMAKGLEERERIKDTFNKFHNKEIAEKLLSGEVKLGGERKEAIVFFSDIRNFTAMGEAMEPEQVVEMLNEYMTCMVATIRKHSGVVDKYVGDAIMALWGVPLGSPADVENSVKACLVMRQELAKLNELRLSRGQNELRIGMGLNIGDVIAGNIGSNEKMEYTVIGDTVNLASRIESSTKEFGTDLLISRKIKERLEGKFVFESCGEVKVKGKAEPVEIFKVLGYIENGRPVLVQTPYSSYTAEVSEKVVHEETVATAKAA